MPKHYGKDKLNLQQNVGFKTLIILGCLIGVMIGLGCYTFIYGKGYSYLTSNPKACVNCHIMQPQFDAWQKSSHHNVASCNDCHTPHNFFGKYLVKAINGFQHSWAFTSQNFKEPIRIKGYNRAVTETTCRNCHGKMWEATKVSNHSINDISCIRCHGAVGHRL